MTGKRKRVGDPDSAAVAVPPARTDRPRHSLEPLTPGELVRIEIRVPAVVAAALFDHTLSTQAPMSRAAALLLARALDWRGPSTSTCPGRPMDS